MLKKVQEYLIKKEENLKKKQELLKAQQYYKFIKAGATFIQFIQQDLERQEGDLNRHERRRMLRELNKEGKLTPEIVEYYQKKLDYILYNIYQRLNPPKIQSQNNNRVQVQTSPPPEVKK